MRELLVTNRELRQKIEIMESKYDKKFRVVFDAIKQLWTDEEKPKRKIGFKS